jgi:hypothetical protein
MQGALRKSAWIDRAGGFSLVELEESKCMARACRKSNPDILVMQSTQDRTAKNVSSAMPLLGQLQRFRIAPRVHFPSDGGVPLNRDSVSGEIAMAALGFCASGAEWIFASGLLN